MVAAEWSAGGSRRAGRVQSLGQPAGTGRNMTISMGGSRQLEEAVDPLQLIQRVADQTLSVIDAADGALVGLGDGDDVLFFCGAGAYRSWVGLRVPKDGSLAGECMRQNAVLVAHDAETDGRANVAATRQLGIRSVISVPIRRGDDCLGAVNLGAVEPHAFSPRDVDVLTDVVEFVSAVVLVSAELSASARRLLERSPDLAIGAREARKVEAFVANVLSPAATRLREDRALVQEILDQRRVEMYYQPIVDLREGGMFAVESLARFWEEPYRPPNAWFALATEVGLGLELEMLAIEMALERLPDLAPGVRMTVNASPAVVLSPRLLEILGGSRYSDRIILEITEHAGVEDYDVLTATLDLVRRTGVQVAIDDTGAGVSSLSHILRLEPEFIKLDRYLVTGVDGDPARRALASSLVGFAAETGARIVAEGIERREELDELRRLGVELAQGFFLSLPRPFAELPDEAKG